MTISASQQTALEQSATRVVYFCEFQFATATLRVNTTNQTITWGGFDWIGLGSVSNIGAVEESDGMEPRSLSFTLNAAQPSWLALSVGPVEEYRGQPAKMYFCPLDSGFLPVGNPEICWSGLMDVVSVGMSGDEGSINLKCETSAYGLKRRQVSRINAAQHKLKNPTDTGFDYLTSLIAQPQLWLSKRFQTI